MPTILLQEIRDLLAGFITQVISFLTGLLNTLEAVKDDTAAIVENTNTLPDIKENTDVLPDIADDTSAITVSTANIENLSMSIDLHAGSLDNKATTANNWLQLLNEKGNEISGNTAAIVTPIQRINENVLSIKNNSDAMRSKVDTMAQYIPVISDNTGRAAAYAEDTATNTLDIYNKIVTMASDTTQMRADNQNIIAILNQIYDKL